MWLCSSLSQISERDTILGIIKKASKIFIIGKMIILIICFASTAYAELKLDSVYPTLGELGKNLEVTIKGSGFDGSTRVSMYLDSGNRRAIIGSVDTPNEATQVAVAGTKAYVTGGTSLQVIDVSNLTSPQIIGSVDTPGNAFGVAVVGTTAYVVDDIYFMDTGLKIVDVSDPPARRLSAP